MVATRVQLRRPLANAPAVGTWDAYIGACFETTDPEPTATVRGLLVNLFSGANATNLSTARIISNEAFDLGSNACQLSTWSWSGSWSLEYAGNLTLPQNAVGSGDVYGFPHQLGISVGYRAELGTGVPRQRGRSRFWLGPLLIKGTVVTGGVATGGLRLTAAGCDQLVSNVTSTLAALASEGWSLVVKSGSGPYTFHDAVEIYVEDVFSVQRTRRPWSNYQARATI